MMKVSMAGIFLLTSIPTRAAGSMLVNLMVDGLRPFSNATYHAAWRPSARKSSEKVIGVCAVAEVAKRIAANAASANVQRANLISSSGRPENAFHIAQARLIR